MSEKLKKKIEEKKELTIEQEIDSYFQKIGWTLGEERTKKVCREIKKLHKKGKFDEPNKIDNRTPRQIFEKARKYYEHALGIFDDKNSNKESVEKWKNELKGINRILDSMEKKEKK